MKKFYKKHPLIVILTSVIAAIIIGTIGLSALLLPKQKTSKQDSYALYTVKVEADNIFKGNVTAKRRLIIEKICRLVNFHKSM